MLQTSDPIRRRRIESVLKYHSNVEKAWNRAKDIGEEIPFIRKMVTTDVYFLLYYVLERTDMLYEEFTEGVMVDGIPNGQGDEPVGRDDMGRTVWRWYRPFLFERCREIQKEPDGYLDVWARDHYKSTIITYALTIQEILRNPEITICIMSYNSSTAEKMVGQIKNVLQSNQTLLTCFPDILFENTNVTTWKDSDGARHRMEWSNDGFNVKRRGNPKEHTLECSGLVNGQKIGGHFNLLIYDDTVVPESVYTPNQIRKTTDAFKMSINIGSTANMRIRMIGTFYAYGDTYQQILEEKIVRLRRYPCVDENGRSVLYTEEALRRKLNRMNGYVTATQMMCDPRQISTFQFEESWLGERFNPGDISSEECNWYIIVDPAQKVSEGADYTVMWVIATMSDRSYWCVELIRDKLDLSGKQKTLFSLVQKYTNSQTMPTVFYESVSMQADVQYMRMKMDELHIHFTMMPASGKPKLGFGISSGTGVKYKDLRIGALQPLLRDGKVHFPSSSVHTNWRGEEEDFMKSFVEQEYLLYPNTRNDDALDALSRIADLETGATISFPMDIRRKKSERCEDIFSERCYQPF